MEMFDQRFYENSSCHVSTPSDPATTTKDELRPRGSFIG